MRLQKFLSMAGLCSRREAEKHIQAGLVKVNEEVISTLGTQVDPETDSVKFKNKIIELEEENVYLLLNKPAGFLSTCKDTHERKTILDLVPAHKRLFPIGRLDKESEGLIILTNNGNLTYKLTHPKHHIEKEYLIECKGKLTPTEKEKLEKGIMLNGKKTAPCQIHIQGGQIFITIHEGRKRQIRNMFEIIGHPVHYLQRIRIGHIKLDNLKRGDFRVLKKKEIEPFLK